MKCRTALVVAAASVGLAASSASAQLAIPATLDAEAIFTDLLTTHATVILSALSVSILMIVIISFGRHVRGAVRWLIG